MNKKMNTFPYIASALLCIINCVFCFNANASTRNYLFNDQWRFVRDSIQGAQSPSFDDSHWLTVDLPHDFSMMALPGGDNDEQVGAFSKHSPGGNHTGHVMGGTGWYRKSFVVDAADRGKRFFLDFDGAYMETDVWVNGKRVGEHKNGYTPFCFDITAALNKPGTPNIVAVKVDNIGRNSRWYSGSGLYRNVHLIVTSPLHVATWGAYVSTPDVSVDKATVNVQLTLKNEYSKKISAQVEISLIDKNGAVAAVSHQNISLAASSESTLRQSMNVLHPRLWSVDEPNMYRAQITIKSHGKLVDSYTQPFGIRTISFSATRGFLLNGKPLLLKGGCIHHDNGFLGAAAIDRAEYRRVEMMKANGYNAIRCSHNPPSETFLNACDELGILVIDEFTDMWELYKNPNDYSRFFDKWWESDLTCMMQRDRNHPSIIMWSIGNEIPKADIAQGVKIGTMLRDKVRQLDGTRAVTEAVPSFLIHGGWKNTKDYFALLDACGYNYMLAKYESDHQLYPDRVMYASESYPGQAYDYWKAVENHPYVIGDFVWTAMDYIGEVSVACSKYAKQVNTRNLQTRDGIAVGTNPIKIFDMMEKYSPSTWPAYLSWCGDIDIIGDKKPQGLYRDVLWDRSVIEMNVHEPKPDSLVEDISLWGWPREVPSWNWSGCEGKPLQVRVFTKAQQVRLLLNEQVIGEKTLTDADKYIATFDVPYAPGTLTAVAINNGAEVGRRTLVTTGAPHSIRLIVDRNAIHADRNDLAFIKIEMVDAHGNVVPTDASQVEISVTGCGEMAASGNADPMGMKSANKRVLNLFRGRAQVIVRPFAKSGIITVSVKAESMDAASLDIKVK